MFILYDGVLSFIIEIGGGIVRGSFGRLLFLEMFVYDVVIGNVLKKLYFMLSVDECGVMFLWGVIGEINVKYF